MTYAPRVMALVVVLTPALELLAQVAEEAARIRAVNEAVVVREGDVHDRADRYHVLAELVLDHPWPLDDRVGPEDSRLRLADHGRAVERAVAARIRDRERAALDVVREQLLVARPGGDVRDRPGHAEQVQVLGVPHDGHDQALAVGQLDGEAEVDVVPR